jgi:hypothetical protein
MEFGAVASMYTKRDSSWLLANLAVTRNNFDGCSCEELQIDEGDESDERDERDLIWISEID